jgi:hypothetical protein
MKGIYLTEQAKKELETEIAELARTYREYGCWEEKYGELQTLRKILSSAIVLPVEKSYNDIQHFETSEHGTIIRKHFLMSNYSTGIIIQPEN